MKSKASEKRLEQLRASMADRAIDIYIIPTGDPNTGEYIPDHWKIIPWLTGFTGSAATVAVTMDSAFLWTDPRYFVQAQQQLEGSGFDFMNPSRGNGFGDWLSERSEKKGTLGLDGRIISETRLRQIAGAVKPGRLQIDHNCDLIDELWTDRPPASDSLARDFPLSFAGKERGRKIAEVRELMLKEKADYHFLSSVDDIMWMLNIRGSDLRYSPLFMSYALAGHDQVLLFADEHRIPFRLSAEFDRQGVVILPREETAAVLASLPRRARILLSPSATPASLFRSIPNPRRIIEGPSVPARLKAVKNPVEIANIEKTMAKDGAALTRFFRWLETGAGDTVITESLLAEKLESSRAMGEDYLGPSFNSIVAFKEHAALPHYSIPPGTGPAIEAPGLLLIDSGGQYMTGTTDITRTITLGKPDQGMINDFTLVLKGHIRLATARFPAGTKGIQLDILARKDLWEKGLNYGHGTGHGVGFCLNVHESPPSVSPAETYGSSYPLEPGMLISNEPALYREGQYGIRTENLVLCYEDEETEFGKFLKFETVSLCFIDSSLIDKSMLDDRELEWINTYHRAVFDKLSPLLNEEEREWLLEKTASL